MVVLQNDNEQLEQEKTALKERLKQLTKDTLFNDIMKKKTAGLQRTSGPSSTHRVVVSVVLQHSFKSRSRDRWQRFTSTSIGIRIRYGEQYGIDSQ